MLDDFVMNASYDAWSEDYEEMKEIMKEMFDEDDDDLKS